MPKPGERITYLPTGSSEWKIDTITGFAGKRSTNKKYWLNFQPDVGHPFSLDWSRAVDDWTVLQFDKHNVKKNTVEEKECLIISNDCNSKKIEEAKVKELENWKNFEVYEEIPNTSQFSISVRWVCTEKTG